MKKMEFYLRIIILTLIISPVINSNEFRRDATVVFGGGGPERPRQDSVIAMRSTVGFSGTYLDYNIIRDINPDFKWLRYISAMDSYVSGPVLDEHEYVSGRAVEEGLDPEINYLHYWDDTYINLEGQSIFIPGYGGGSATSKDQSRVPVYYANQSRAAKNFFDPNSRKYHVEYAVNVLKTLPKNSNVGYYSGIMWDNSAGLYNYGRIDAGGHIAEHPQKIHIDSGRVWFWENLRDFHVYFMDTLSISEQWAPDGQKKISHLNIGGVWYDDYCTYRVADMLGKENYYSTIKNFAASTVMKSYSEDSLAFENGQSVVYLARPYTSMSGYEGTYTIGEALVGNLSWFYITSTDSSYLTHVGVGAPGYPEWDTLNWCGAMDFNVGRPVENRYQIAQTGTDDRGYNYTIFSREYQGAKILMRNRGSWREHIDEQTAVDLELGATYREVRPDGNLGPIVTSISLRNGQGRIMAPATASSDLTPPAATYVTANQGGVEGVIDISWSATGDDGHNGLASYYEIKYSPDYINESNWDNLTTTLKNPPFPGQSGTTHNAAISNLIPGVTYHIGIKVYDYSNNSSELSNIADAVAGVGLSTGGGGNTIIPQILVPNNAVPVTIVRPILSAQNITTPGDNFYYFDISDDSIFMINVTSSPPVPQSSSNFTEWQVPNEFERDMIYYWRVKVNDYDFSSTASFLLEPNVYAYPNPVDFLQGETVRFVLPDYEVNLLITTVTGETVKYEENILSDWDWDGLNDSGQTIAVGVYLWYIEGTEFKGKIIYKH